MRVLHLIDHLGPGGSQTCLLDLLETTSPPFSHEVWSLSSRVLPAVASRLDASGFPWRVFDAGRRPFRELGAVRSLLARDPPRVLHAHLDASNALAGLLVRTLRGHGCRLVLTLENDPRLHYSRSARLGFTYATRVADALIVISESLRASLGPVRCPTVTIHPGIDLDRYRRDAVAPEAARAIRGQASRVVAGVGRLARQKGLDVLVEAMPALLEDEPSTRVIIAGDGPEKEALTARARALEVAGSLELPGHMVDPRPLYAAADVFVLPSRHEGYGLVFLEAMAMGTPVVGTQVVGTMDAVRAGDTGFLVPPEDPSALAECILSLFGDPGKRKSLSARGLEWVRDHGSRVGATGAVERLYMEITATL